MAATRSSWQPGKACSCSTATRRVTGPRSKLGTGNQEAKPFKGASEVKVGHLLNGSPFIATIEPWHGFQVVVYTAPGATSFPGSTASPGSLWSRHVIAEPVQWGHAVWCADLDSDGDDELIIGQRDPNKPGAIGPKGPGVFVFDIKRWKGLARLRPAYDRRRRNGLRGCAGGRPGRRRPHRHHRRWPCHA